MERECKAINIEQTVLFSNTHIIFLNLTFAFIKLRIRFDPLPSEVFLLRPGAGQVVIRENLM